MLSTCRTPPGVRGLKLCPLSFALVDVASHPARGAWIETGSNIVSASVLFGRTPPGVRGLKHKTFYGITPIFESHPARGAWIETLISDAVEVKGSVAPRPGCVD